MPRQPRYDPALFKPEEELPLLLSHIPRRLRWCVRKIAKVLGLTPHTLIASARQAKRIKETLGYDTALDPERVIMHLYEPVGLSHAVFLPYRERVLALIRKLADRMGVDWEVITRHEDYRLLTRIIAAAQRLPWLTPQLQEIATWFLLDYQKAVDRIQRVPLLERRQSEILGALFTLGYQAHRQRGDWIVERITDIAIDLTGSPRADLVELRNVAFAVFAQEEAKQNEWYIKA
ncbi:MAG: hypothetical protein HY459_01835 [Parcubacteria group bacterium]|nr:hypothetical protein [Parcubacteria group bacterium]